MPLDLSAQSKPQRLKALISARAAVPMPGVYDAFSARFVEQAGFPACFVSGFGLAAAMLGLPDIGILSLRDQINGVQAIAGAIDIPVMADGDTGFGNALNTYHAVRMLEAAGAAGVNLEDQTFPKRCGHMDGKDVISCDEMVQKIKAAVSAKRDPDFVINARTDALATEGLDAAIDRANAYLDAGADIAFVEALRSREEIATVVQRVHGPVSVNMLGTTGGKTPSLPLLDLRAMGVARVSYPGVTLASAGAAMQGALRSLYSDGSLDGFAGDLMGFADLTEVVGLSVERAREVQWVTS